MPAQPIAARPFLPCRCSSSAGTVQMCANELVVQKAVSRGRPHRRIEWHSELSGLPTWKKSCAAMGSCNACCKEACAHACQPFEALGPHRHILATGNGPRCPVRLCPAKMNFWACTAEFDVVLLLTIGHLMNLFSAGDERCVHGFVLRAPAASSHGGVRLPERPRDAVQPTHRCSLHACCLSGCPVSMCRAASLHACMIASQRLPSSHLMRSPFLCRPGAPGGARGEAYSVHCGDGQPD